MKKSVFVVIAALALGAVGCSVGGNIENSTTWLSIPLMGQLTGVSSGSMQNRTTPEGQYVVSSTVGEYTSGSIEVTTNIGYKIYSTVQGNMVSQSTQQQLSQ